MDSSGFLARALPGADVEEEPDQEREPDRQEHDQQRGVGVGLQDPEAPRRTCRPPTATAPTTSKRRVGSGGSGSTTPAAEQDDRHDDQGLEDERGAPADAGRDHAADQRSGRGADAAQPADHPERPARDSSDVNAIVVRM